MIPRLITLIAQTKIQKVQDLSLHPLYSYYQHYLPLLEKLYPQAAYWHGTGRYHYKLKGSSKYEGVDHSQTYDVLESVIGAGGLSPQYDPFLKIDGDYKSSISTTPYRIYARSYAEFNMPHGQKFQYTYGSTRFWFYYLLPLLLLERNILISVKNIINARVNKSVLKNTKSWFHAFNRNPPWTLFDFYQAFSDIPHNYGLLFGIKRGAVKPLNVGKFVGRFETRASNLIKIKDITHLEVPLTKVAEIESFLKKKKIRLPVIPLEIGELYCNQYSLAKLSGVE